MINISAPSSLCKSSITFRARESNRCPGLHHRFKHTNKKDTNFQIKRIIIAYIWTGCYVCMGLAFVALCLTFIKGLFTGKKKETGPLAVPGLTQASEESDPLAGTFTDSDQPLNK